MAKKYVISLLHYHYQLFWNWTQPRAFQDQMISLILCARSTLWLLYQIKTYTFISADCRTCKASCCSYWRHSPSPMSGTLLTWISRYFGTFYIITWHHNQINTHYCWNLFVDSKNVLRIFLSPCFWKYFYFHLLDVSH